MNHKVSLKDLERWGVKATFDRAADAHKKNQAIDDVDMAIILEADQTGDLPDELQRMLDVRFGRRILSPH